MASHEQPPVDRGDTDIRISLLHRIELGSTLPKTAEAQKLFKKIEVKGE